MWFFQSTEFFVLLLFVAAAVVAACARPSRRGQAVTRTFAGWLMTTGKPEPAVDIDCLDNGDVRLTRTGLEGVRSDGAVSLAVVQIGRDLEIKERITPGSMLGESVDTACFTFKFMGADWYHVKYESESTGRMAAFSLHNRPGIHMTMPLKQ